MLVALRLMDPAALQRSERAPRAPGQVRAALAYVRRTPELRVPLADDGRWSGRCRSTSRCCCRCSRARPGTAPPATYAPLTAVMGVGSVLGALAAGARGRVSPRLLVGSAALFGAAELLAAVAPTLPLQALALIPLGAASVTFAAGVNSSLQLAAEPAMRGRVMSLYAIVFLGSTAIGAPLIGWLAQAAGPRSPGCSPARSPPWSPRAGRGRSTAAGCRSGRAASSTPS